MPVVNIQQEPPSPEPLSAANQPQVRVYLPGLSTDVGIR